VLVAPTDKLMEPEVAAALPVRILTDPDTSPSDVPDSAVMSPVLEVPEDDFIVTKPLLVAPFPDIRTTSPPSEVPLEPADSKIDPPAPPAEEPTDNTMPPDIPAAAVPVLKVTLPLFPPALDPDESFASPLLPLSPRAFADARITLPLAPELLPPLLAKNMPPVASALVPAWMLTEPPAPDPLDPTAREMLPACP
jgi:hypothetical protein